MYQMFTKKISMILLSLFSSCSMYHQHELEIKKNLHDFLDEEIEVVGDEDYYND